MSAAGGIDSVPGLVASAASRDSSPAATTASISRSAPSSSDTRGSSARAAAGETAGVTMRSMRERKLPERSKATSSLVPSNRPVKSAFLDPTSSPELVASITRRSQNALEVIAKATNELSNFYNALSAHNLSPEARLYAITGPFTERTVQSLSRGRVVLAFALVMMLTWVLVPAGCLIHASTRKRTNVPSPAARV